MTLRAFIDEEIAAILKSLENVPRTRENLHVFIEAGRTKVICTASIEDRVPPFLRNTGKGWVPA